MVYREALRRRLSKSLERRIRRTAEGVRRIVERVCDDILHQLGERMGNNHIDYFTFESGASGDFVGRADDVEKLLRECEIDKAVLRVLKVKWDASFYGSADFNDVDAKPFPFEALSDVLKIDYSVSGGGDLCMVLLCVNVDVDKLIEDCEGQGPVERDGLEEAAASFREWAESYDASTNKEGEDDEDEDEGALERGKLYIKEFLERRVSRLTGGFEYLVRWGRFGDDEEAIWEPAEGLPSHACREFDKTQRESKRRRA